LCINTCVKCDEILQIQWNYMKQDSIFTLRNVKVVCFDLLIFMFPKRSLENILFLLGFLLLVSSEALLGRPFCYSIVSLLLFFSNLLECNETFRVDASSLVIKHTAFRFLIYAFVYELLPFNWYLEGLLSSLYIRNYARQLHENYTRM
jgi:hypothetical protein